MLVPTLASQLRVISQWIFSPYTASTRISSELSRVKTSERILFPVSTVQKLPSLSYRNKQPINGQIQPSFFCCWAQHTRLSDRINRFLFRPLQLRLRKAEMCHQKRYQITDSVRNQTQFEQDVFLNIFELNVTYSSIPLNVNWVDRSEW